MALGHTDFVSSESRLHRSCFSTLAQLYMYAKSVKPTAPRSCKMHSCIGVSRDSRFARDSLLGLRPYTFSNTRIMSGAFDAINDFRGRAAGPAQPSSVQVRKGSPADQRTLASADARRAPPVSSLAGPPPAMAGDQHLPRAPTTSSSKRASKMSDHPHLQSSPYPQGSSLPIWH